MLKKKEIWDQVLKRLEAQIPKSHIETWFATTRLAELTDETAVIEVPNKFVATWLRDQYKDHIADAFQKNVAHRPRLLFELRSTEYSDYSEGNKQSSRLSNYLNPLLTFENFLTGEGNRLAYSSATTVAEGNCKDDCNPLYFFSRSSLGKTHLLNAIGNRAHRKNPVAKVEYITANRFGSSFLNALRTGHAEAFRQRYRNLDLLLLDDIQELSGKPKIQQELISLFDILFKDNKQVVLAGKSPPKDMPGLDEHLASRISSGLVSEIRLPDRKTRIKIVAEKGRQEHVNIPEDVVLFLANRGSDIREIIKNVVRVISHSSLYGDSITISKAKASLDNAMNSDLSIQSIQRATAEHFNVSLSDILSASRSRSNSYPRQIAMYLCRELIRLPFHEIGRCFGGRNHATVIHAVNRIERDREKNEDVSSHLKTIQDLLH